jgi:hypothetical protein
MDPLNAQCSASLAKKNDAYKGDKNDAKSFISHYMSLLFTDVSLSRKASRVGVASVDASYWHLLDTPPHD